MKRLLRTLIFPLAALLFAVVLLVAVYDAQSQSSTRENDSYAALQVLALINEYRMQIGLNPLRQSETLNAMALFHARELSTYRDIPHGPTIHTNRAGDGVKERAQYEQFNWTPYRAGDVPIVGEIAAVYSVEGAMNFWRSSTPHRNSMSTAYYREVGVAAIQRRAGSWIFIVVFGSRPNVLPAMQHPETGDLYLTRDLYPFAKSRDLLLEPDQVRLFGENGQPISGWLDWQPTLPVPKGGGSVVFVLYRNSAQEDVQVLSEVTLMEDIVMLPDYVPTPSPTPTATLTPMPTLTPTLAISLTPSSTPTPTITPSPTPEPGPELRLIYDAERFVLLNQESWNVNLFPVTFAGAGQTLSTVYWREVTGVPLGTFRPGYCLQAWTVNRLSAPALPEDCLRLAGGRGRLTATQRFWIEDFEVLYQGEVIATCSAAAGVCEVDIPGLP